MKTIFITISRGSIAKNLFHTGIIHRLPQDQIRVVVLTPAFKDAKFTATFSAPNLYFENLPAARFGRIDRVLVALARGIIYNRTTYQIDRYGVYNTKETSLIKYAIKALFFRPLSHIPFLRDCLRWLEALLSTNKELIPLFEKWNPDLVFSTNISESDDADIVKVARRKKVKVVALPKSWDNCSKLSFRAKADLLLVWSDYMKREAMRFQNYKESDIIVAGIPHFDIYLESDRLLKREDFFALIGADKNKKLLFFGSEGKVSRHDGEIVFMIYEMIKNGELALPAQLFIRPYLAFREDGKKFEHMRGLPDVFIDNSFISNDTFYDHWDYSFNQYQFMASAIHHADLMINSMSTLTLDASFNKKPVINIGFEGLARLPYRDSMARWYDAEHCAPVRESGATTIVRSRDELKEAINMYLLHPETKKKEREQFLRHFCGSRTGNASKTVSDILLREINRL